MGEALRSALKPWPEWPHMKKEKFGTVADEVQLADTDHFIEVVGGQGQHLAGCEPPMVRSGSREGETDH